MSQNEWETGREEGPIFVRDEPSGKLLAVYRIDDLPSEHAQPRLRFWHQPVFWYFAVPSLYGIYRAIGLLMR